MNFYDTPCAVCNKGIERTGKRGRPPVAHPECKGQQPKPVVANTNSTQPELPADFIPPEPDAESKVVDKFLRTEPKSKPLPPFDPTRITIMARMLRDGDTLWIRRDGYKVKGNPRPDHEHVHVKLTGHPQGSLKIIADGNVLIAPRL
jgi:hypothetical protein